MHNNMTPSFAVWLTGLPASGKSTIARHVESRLREQGIRAQILDCDALREVLTPQPTYSTAEREWFYTAITYIALLLVNNGVPVLVAATAHRRAYRDHARQQLPRFLEVYVHCPLEICQSRDTKGTYIKALAGGSSTVPGVGAAYETPLNPDLVVNTVLAAPDDGAQEIIEALKLRGWIPA